MNNRHCLGFFLPFALAACGAETQRAQSGGGLPEVDAGAHDGGPTTQYAFPSWERQDMQPQSPRANETYGLETFRGHTLVVVLLEGYCPYCQSNAKVAEQLQSALTAEKRDVEIVVLTDFAADQFVGKIGLRIFHDNLAGRPAWQSMRAGAAKHDTFVFGPNGLRTYFWEGSYTGDAPWWTEEVGAAMRAVAPVR